MQTGIIVLIVIVFIVLIAAISMYNTLVTRKNRVNYALSTIDALLKKRYDLIPNLVNTVKEYMKYEQNLLNQVTELRTKALSGILSTAEKDSVESEIGKLLKNIVVVAENYPELKANANFLQLQAALNEIEEQISAARRAFNASVTEYNNAVKSFPTNVIAGMFNFKEFKWFEIPEEERKNVDVKELFK